MLAIGAGPRLCVLNGRMAILPTAELNSRIWEWYAWIVSVSSYHFYLFLSWHTHNNLNHDFKNSLTGILDTVMWLATILNTSNVPIK